MLQKRVNVLVFQKVRYGEKVAEFTLIAKEGKKICRTYEFILSVQRELLCIYRLAKLSFFLCKNITKGNILLHKMHLIKLGVCMNHVKCMC